MASIDIKDDTEMGPEPGAPGEVRVDRRTPAASDGSRSDEEARFAHGEMKLARFFIQ